MKEEEVKVQERKEIEEVLDQAILFGSKIPAQRNPEAKGIWRKKKEGVITVYQHHY